MFAHDLCDSQIEYFRNAIDFNRKGRATRGASVCAARAIPKIFNLQFRDKSGFTLRYNPASGISATLQPAKLVRVGLLPRHTLAFHAASFDSVIHAELGSGKEKQNKMR